MPRLQWTWIANALLQSNIQILSDRAKYPVGDRLFRINSLLAPSPDPFLMTSPRVGNIHRTQSR
jgi:hypothetical protein